MILVETLIINVVFEIHCMHDPFYPLIHMYIPSLKIVYKNNLVFNINIQKIKFIQHALIEVMNMHEES